MSAEALSYHAQHESFKPAPLLMASFIACCIAERTSFHVFKYGFLLLLIQAFGQSEAGALKLLAGGTALVYLLYTASGIIAQRFTGELWAMAIAAILIPIGNAMVCWAVLTATEAALTGVFFVGVSMALTGTGLFRVNSLVVVSKIFPKESAARQAAFQTLFWAESWGAMLGVVIAAIVAASFGWSVAYIVTTALCFVSVIFACGAFVRMLRQVDGFFFRVIALRSVSKRAMAGIGFGLPLIAAATFHSNDLIGWLTAAAVAVGASYVVRKYHAADEPPQSNASLLRLATVTIAMLLFGLFVEQGISAVVLFSGSFIDLKLETPFANLKLAPNLFLGLFILVTIIATPILTKSLLGLEKRGVNIGPWSLISVGFVLASLSFILISYAAYGYNGGLLSAWWMVAFYILSASSEVFLFPAVFSLATRSMPSRHLNSVTGIWFLNFGVSGFLAHRVAVYISIDASGGGAAALTAQRFTDFFLILGVIGLSYVIVAEGIRRTIGRKIEG